MEMFNGGFPQGYLRSPGIFYPGGIVVDAAMNVRQWVPSFNPLPYFCEDIYAK